MNDIVSLACRAWQLHNTQPSAPNSQLVLQHEGQLWRVCEKQTNSCICGGRCNPGSGHDAVRISKFPQELSDF